VRRASVVRLAVGDDVSVVMVKTSAASLPRLVDAAVRAGFADATLLRGKGYADEGRVGEITWDADEGLIAAAVSGTRRTPYETHVWLARDSQGTFRITNTACDCPVSWSCKHAAAVVLAFQKAARLGSRPEPTVAGWRQALSAFTSALDGDDTDGKRVVPLGLQLRLNNASRAPARRDDVTLSVRPVYRDVGGSWSTGGPAGWDPPPPWFSRDRSPVVLEPAQRRWLTSLGRLVRARSTFDEQRSWYPVEEFLPDLFWPLLAQAPSLGVEISGSARDTVALAVRAELALDLRRADTGALRVRSRVSFDGRTRPWNLVGAAGEGGLFAVTFDGQRRDVVLGPLSAPLTEAHRWALSMDDLNVAPGDVDAFMAEFYLAAARTLTVVSSDRTVDLPEPPRPRLVCAVTHAAVGRAVLDWEWDYDGQRFAFPLSGGSGRVRVAGVEKEIATQVEAVIRAGDAGFRLTGRTEHTGLAAVDLAERALPVLEAFDDVRVERTPGEPVYHELTTDPVVEVSTRSSDDADWFDLGVSVSVDGRAVPLARLLAALARGEDRLFLDDGAWLRTDHPALARLHALVVEARALSDSRDGLRINRYQASLWSDLEDVADVVEQADEWRASAGALAALVREGATPQHVDLAGLVTADLRGYQQHGVDWLVFLHQHRLGGILADDMGLGKTLQVLGLVAQARAAEPADGPFLVVAPASVVGNWVNEAARFAPGLRVHALSQTLGKSGTDLGRLVEQVDVVVTSYAIFRLDFEHLHQVRWAGLVLDEAQFAKNTKTKANEHARTLRARTKIAVTGTPMENSLDELWAVLAIVAPGLFPSLGRFRDQYSTPVTEAGRARVLLAADDVDDQERLTLTETVTVGEEHLARLRSRLRPLMLRRTKELVAPELPQRQEQVLQVDLEPRHRRLYDTFLHRERQRLLGLLDDYDTNRFAIFRSITVLRRMALDASLIDERYHDVPSAKLDTLFEQLDDVIAGGHRALVFSQFTTFLAKVAQRCDARGLAHEYLDGSTRDRASVIDRFKSGDAPVFLISLKAGGFGLNLTEADYVFLLDPWWNPAVENQAIDRTHRIGQTRPVLVQRLVAAGTIEDKVMALKARKADLFRAVLSDDEGTFSTSLTADDVRSLLDVG